LLLLLLLLSSPASDSQWKGMLEPFDHGLPLSVELLDALGLSGLGIPERNSHGADLLVFLEQLLPSIQELLHGPPVPLVCDEIFQIAQGSQTEESRPGVAEIGIGIGSASNSNLRRLLFVGNCVALEAGRSIGWERRWAPGALLLLLLDTGRREWRLVTGTLLLLLLLDA